VFQPQKYDDWGEVRKILISAQERKAPSAEFRYSKRLSRFSAEAQDFVQVWLFSALPYD
jgi:hypothetical protein